MRQVLEDGGIAAADDLDLIVQALDVDHSGKIEYSEFITGCLNLSSEHVRAQIPVAFGIFDLDNSGSITSDELRLILTHGMNDKRPASLPSSDITPFGQSLTGTLLPDGTKVEKVMKDLDVDKNGKVDCFEFERYLLKEHARIASMLEAENDVVADK